MRRTPQQHVRRPEIGIGGYLFAGLLALPFGVGAVLSLLRGQALDAVLFTGMFLIAGYASWTGLRLYARRIRPRAGGIPRSPVQPRPHGQRTR